MNTTGRAASRCSDGCPCEPFAITGAAGAVAAAVVRLLDRGWRMHTEPVESTAGLWRMQVERA